MSGNGNATILVDDDIPENVRLLDAVLAPRGYDVLTAVSGKEALDRVATAQPDLILLDVVAPGIDGYAVCQALRADSPVAAPIQPEATRAVAPRPAWSTVDTGVRMQGRIRTGLRLRRMPNACRARAVCGPFQTEKAPFPGPFAVAGQDLNLRPPGYEPPRLCTRVPPYSAEIQTPRQFLAATVHLGGTR